MSGVPALLAAAGAYGLASAGWRLALQTALARALAEGPAASGGGPDGRARAYGALVWVSNAGAVPAMVGTRSSSWYATG